MFAVRSRRVVTPDGIRPASIHIRNGRIERIGAYDDGGVDYGELAILPGIVDSHVHVNEPGRTEWEGFATATRAAAAGGVTTIIDMPLNSIPPTTSVDALQQKVRAMTGQLRVDTGLWGGAVPGNASELLPMLDEGALGFKCFLVDSGVPEFGNLDAKGLEEALAILAESQAPLLVHAELAGPIDAARAKLTGASSSYRRYVASRPHEAEDEAIQLVYDTAKRTDGHAHIVHLSSAHGLELLRRASAEFVSLTAETTPHYLWFDAESIPDGHPEYKCAPPIRDAANREQLWRGIEEDLLLAIVSDHSPCTPQLKKLDDGDVENAWGGISSLQFSLPIVWTAASRRGMTLLDIARLMSAGPAILAGIDHHKGALEPGRDADFIIFDDTAPLHVEPGMVEHRHKVTPYAGEQLIGVVRETYVRGQNVWKDGEHVGPNIGEWVRR
ncbi:MAG: allantoicase [Acidobacteria bacterium]|nr:allantoicase [Acidobacteriota bacterium]